jgi:hypothetical protein
MRPFRRKTAPPQAGSLEVLGSTTTPSNHKAAMADLLDKDRQVTALINAAETVIGQLHDTVDGAMERLKTAGSGGEPDA